LLSSEGDKKLFSYIYIYIFYFRPQHGDYYHKAAASNIALPHCASLLLYLDDVDDDAAIHNLGLWCSATKNASLKLWLATSTTTSQNVTRKKKQQKQL
jgi:hypothetical protein